MLRFLTAVAVAALLTSGCGYIGDPLTPLANVPAAITEFDAVQQGGRLLVHFKVPERTTEGVKIQNPLNLDLRIGPASEWESTAKTIPPGKVTGGVAQYEIPAADWVGKEVRIAARAIGANRKDSGWSNAVVLPIVPPPAMPAGLQAQPTADGVRLTWEGGGGEFRVFRQAAGEKSPAPPVDVQQPGWVDTASEFGKSYTYRVQRVVKLDNGKVALSDPSAEVSITPVDTFAPSVPTGLRAIPAASSIELTWAQNTELDLAGYRVYRAAPGGAFEKIADTSQIPGYSDRKAEPGKTYRYSVSAVDQAGNESGRSEAAEATAQ